MNDVERQGALARLMKACEFTIQAEPEDIDYHGNCMASSDDAVDRESEEWVRDQLDRGNGWAWCHVVVTASLPGINFVGRDSLGACSYTGEEDFKADGGYYDDMKREAARDLLEGLESNYKEAREALRGLGVNV